MKIKEFRIRYIGTNPFTEATFQDELRSTELDEGGVLEVVEVKPTVEVCPTCDGTGNIDDKVGFELDCKDCGGTGYIEVEQ